MVLSLDSQFPAGIIMQSLYIAQLYDACWGQGQFCIPSRAILGGARVTLNLSATIVRARIIPRSISNGHEDLL
jgi:hypothetical protein